MAKTSSSVNEDRLQRAYLHGDLTLGDVGLI